MLAPCDSELQAWLLSPPDTTYSSCSSATTTYNDPATAPIGCAAQQLYSVADGAACGVYRMRLSCQAVPECPGEARVTHCTYKVALLDHK